MNIAGLQKSSLLDYPSKIAAVIFTLGCNFRCPYCHNPNLITAVSSKKLIDETAVFDFLYSRKGKLDAVVISGGEPTLQSDLICIFEKIKNLGFLTKLDTNGTNPDILQKLINQKLVDYVAMDIKAPIEKYDKVVGRDVDLGAVKKSVEIIKNSGLNYEFRTTVVRSLLSIKDFEDIAEFICGAKNYYLQKFVSSVTLDANFSSEKTYTDEEFEKIKNILQKKITNVFVR